MEGRQEKRHSSEVAAARERRSKRTIFKRTVILMVLCGVSAPNACTGYAPLSMPDAAFEEDFVYDAETGNYPAAYIMLPEPRLVAVGLPHGTTRIPVVCRLSIV